MELWKRTVIFAVLIFESAVISEENKQSTTTKPVDKNKPNITTEQFINKTENNPNKKSSINTTPKTSTTADGQSHNTVNKKEEIEDITGLSFLPTEDSKNLVYTLEESNSTATETKDQGSKLYNDTVIDKIYLFDQFYGNVNGSKSEMEPVGIVPGKLAAILAAVFLIVSIIGYILMLSWRRYMENRYGNRELLVEDDYCEKMSNLEEFSKIRRTCLFLDEAVAFPGYSPYSFLLDSVNKN